MKKLSCLIIFLSLASSSLALDPSNQPIYESFLKCFSNQTCTAPNKLCDVVLPQSSASFTPTLRAYIRNARYNTSTSPKPLIVIAARSEAHVQATVLCTKSLNFQLKTRSGGHDYDGVSYISNRPYFVLDMSYLRNITVDMADGGGSAWVGAGATLGEVYYSIWQKSKSHGFPAGVCPTVGAGGHISGGGYGNMIRKYGLSVDYVTDAKIVDVNGRILDRKSMGEDLFWAIGGGGGASFGVILAFKIKLVAVPPTVTVFRVEKTLEENALDMVHKWQFVAPKTSPDLFMRLLLQPKTMNTTQTVRASVVALFLGRQSDLLSLLGKEFPELGLRTENCTEMTWIQSVMWWANSDNATLIKPEILLDREPDSASFLKRKSDYVETEISKEGLGKEVDATAWLAGPEGMDGLLVQTRDYAIVFDTAPTGNILPFLHGCERVVKHAIYKLRGVDSVEVNLELERVTVVGYVERKKVLKAVRRAGKRAEFWPYPDMPRYFTSSDHYFKDTTREFRESYNYYRHGYNLSDRHGHIHVTNRGDDKVSNFFNDDNVHACRLM
ncbi:hypothetical protein F2Q70_00043792 [Brassica cretica]|uniref:FAD-binding PCMH-type domain-containing protein n=1 Tax=Brassica cretica TaxID=69181 RepID=A0A8S9KI41_BRACR|nr:hypothetical protein F2Q70_00043792 [Brassica cretica]